MKRFPLAKPHITPGDIRAVVDVMETPHLSRGPKTPAFEEAVAKYIGGRYAVATNSGTSALHLAVRALGIGEGDHVITTSMSFVASSHAIVFEKAIPIFVDIEPQTLTIDPGLVEKKIIEFRKKKKRVRAILAVDIFGYLADWKSLRCIAKKYKVALIEDSCQALGSRVGKKRAGSFGDVGVFSFYPNKILTTAEGGMLVTNDKRIADMAKSLRNQGMAAGTHWGEYDKLGYNYHLSDIHSALGLSQLRRMNVFIQRQKEIMRQYTKQFGHFANTKGVRTLVEVKNIFSVPFACIIHLPKKFGRKERDLLVARLALHKISARSYLPAIHLTTFYRKTLGYKRGDFPVTEYFADRGLALPFYHSLSPKDIAYIVRSINNILGKL